MTSTRRAVRPDISPCSSSTRAVMTARTKSLICNQSGTNQSLSDGTRRSKRAFPGLLRRTTYRRSAEERKTSRSPQKLHHNSSIGIHRWATVTLPCVSRGHQIEKVGLDGQALFWRSRSVGSGGRQSTKDKSHGIYIRISAVPVGWTKTVLIVLSRGVVFHN